MRGTGNGRRRYRRVSGGTGRIRMPGDGPCRVCGLPTRAMLTMPDGKTSFRLCPKCEKDERNGLVSLDR